MNDSRKLWRGLALPLTAAFGVSALAACGTDDATNGDDLRRNDRTSPRPGLRLLR